MKNPSVRIKTNYGSMEAELFKQEAPNTVANFLSYVENGFYENTLFHRVMVNFVIQGGGLNPGLYQKKSDKPIQNEATNGLKNEKFTLSMARLPTHTRQPVSFLSTWPTTIFWIIREGTILVIVFLAGSMKAPISRLLSVKRRPKTVPVFKMCRHMILS